MKKPNKRNGFTLVELMIALALMSVLLASLGFGMRAAMQAYDENDRLAQVTQTARVVLNRMAGEIRTARYVSADDHSITIIPSSTNIAGVSKIEYSYVAGSLYYNQYSGDDTTSWVLLTQSVVLTADDEMVCIKNFAVASDSGTDYRGLDVTSNVMVALLIRCGDREYPYTISVAPRRAQMY